MKEVREHSYHSFRHTKVKIDQTQSFIYMVSSRMEESRYRTSALLFISKEFGTNHNQRIGEFSERDPSPHYDREIQFEDPEFFLMII